MKLEKSLWKRGKTYFGKEGGGTIFLMVMRGSACLSRRTASCVVVDCMIRRLVYFALWLYGAWRGGSNCGWEGYCSETLLVDLVGFPCSASVLHF